MSEKLKKIYSDEQVSKAYFDAAKVGAIMGDGADDDFLIQMLESGAIKIVGEKNGENLYSSGNN